MASNGRIGRNGSIPADSNAGASGSRLLAPGRLLDDANEKLIRQARTRRGLADKLKFVQNGLQFQLEWYEARVKDVADDADTQAILVALAEQTRVRLDRWDRLMREMKVPPD